MESAAQSIVTKLGQLLLEEVQDIRGVGDKVAHLTDELATMNAVLRMISEADETAVDHLAREWEKQVRELAYDAEDCADIYRIGIGRRRQRTPRSLPHRHGGVAQVSLVRPCVSGDCVRGRPPKEALKVFSIVGFGGLGKTTLAVELCRQLEPDFQRQALVSVSQAFDGSKDMKALLARLFPQIDKLKQEEAAGRTHANQLNIDQMDVEGLSTKLNEHLKDK
ncbi:unnamed protein product, partial [Urochloa decumbens]